MHMYVVSLISLYVFHLFCFVLLDYLIVNSTSYVSPYKDDAASIGVLRLFHPVLLSEYVVCHL